MGDIADAVLDGLLCESCGALIDGEAPGYVRNCCVDDDEEDLWANELDELDEDEDEELEL